MYAHLIGGNWPKWYFTIFYIVSIMIILNIVVSFVMEIYEVSLEESDANLKKITDVKAIRDAAPTEELLEELIEKIAIYNQMADRHLSLSSNSDVSKDFLPI